MSSSYLGPSALYTTTWSLIQNKPSGVGDNLRTWAFNDSADALNISQLGSGGLINLTSDRNGVANSYIRNFSAGSSAYNILNIGNNTSHQTVRFIVPSSAAGAWGGPNALSIVNTQNAGILLWTYNALALCITPTQNAVNYLQASGSVTGQNPYIAAAGLDSNISLRLLSRGTGVIAAMGDPSNVNYLGLNGSTTGNSVTVSAMGTDLDININLVPKGNGKILFNGKTSTSNAKTYYLGSI